MEKIFNTRTPHLLVVDDFYYQPDDIEATARSLPYYAESNSYKGLRTAPHLLPHVKEEFERLLGARITDWMQQPMNGVFQITTGDDPLVWHSDTQDYAAAVYLTKDADSMGTSFWRHKGTGCRRPSNHALEGKPAELCDDIYSDYNITHPDNWQLVDKVGAVYNRLVIWDAKLIHSASQYAAGRERLVQLFFFSIEK